jgi:hypothetical protein
LQSSIAYYLKMKGEAMTKRFNTTGVCVPKKYYMIDISGGIEKRA